MPVTELAFFTTLANGAITPGFEAAFRQVVRVQDEWCAANLPGWPRGHEARGAALFQQVEDPAAVLLTAHWESVAQHGLWIASGDNRREFAAGMQHIDPNSVRYFHVEGVEAFPPSVLQAPVVGVARYFVAQDRKAEFETVYGSVKGIKDEYAKPHVHRGGWRIEKQEGSEGVEEYVVVGGWDSAEAARGFTEQKDFSKYTDALKSVLLDGEVKNYKRLL